MYADITIKARCPEPAELENNLLENGAVYVGLDVQTDTFYEVDYGRLKHRQGNIENVLIHYNRTLTQGVHQTEVLLYLKNPSATAVTDLYGSPKVLAQVKKLRKIFFIDNVKFHLDHLEGHGHFVEIEAIDLDGSLGMEHVRQQCDVYQELLDIKEDDLVNDSYFDLHHS